MKHTPYKYKFYCNSITIVSRFESGYNIFDTLKEAKEYGCQHPHGINEAEHAAYRERLRLVTKEELFDELFDDIEDNAKLIAAAPELLKQVKSLSYCFGELLNHRESIPTRLGWDHEKLEDWKKVLDELVIKAKGK